MSFSSDDQIISETILISQDSRHVAYVAVKDSELSVYVDDQGGKLYPDIGVGTLIFSPDSQRLVYVAIEENKQFVVINGTEEKKYDSILSNSIVFSPDSSRLAYAARDGDKEFAVLDGMEQNRYDEIIAGTLTFSPDSKRFAYAARPDWNKAFLGEPNTLVVVDGEEGILYEGVGPTAICYSPGGGLMKPGKRSVPKGQLLALTVSE
jgi:Tol biopolymer transport system component